MVIDYLFEKSAPGGFDLIVMDIMMPEMNGYGAARGYQYAAKGVGKCIMSFDIIMIKTAEKRIKKVKKSVDTDSILCYTMSCVEANKTKRGLRKCRNWQTSKTKDLVAAMSCGFKSHLPHDIIKGLSLRLSPFIMLCRRIRITESHGAGSRLPGTVSEEAK